MTGESKEVPNRQIDPPLTSSDSDVDHARLLPVLTMQSQVLFPGCTLTLAVTSEAGQSAISKSAHSDRLLVIDHAGPSVVHDPDATKLRVLAEVLSISSASDSSLRVILRGCTRIDPRGMNPINEIEASVRRQRIEELLSEWSAFQFETSTEPEWIRHLCEIQSLDEWLDRLAHHLPLTIPEKLQVLKADTEMQRLEILHGSIEKLITIAEMRQELSRDVDMRIAEAQKRVFLREQLSAIQEQLGVRRKIEERVLFETSRDQYPSEVTQVIEAELHRLEESDGNAQEETVARAYLRELLQFPWKRSIEERIDIVQAKEILECHHFGQNAAKTALLEFLAIRLLGQNFKGGLLCFHGPPGVGKTSLANALGEVLGRPVERIALGGIRDDGELRGHRRTYVGARPGRLASSVRRSGVKNPIIILDEIDKLIVHPHSDPLSVLLEALDPVQNQKFLDAYFEIPLDLSEVTFIATANQLNRLPRELIDRLETVEFFGYSQHERTEIAERYLLPRLRVRYGISDSEPRFTREAIQDVCRQSSQESGVRGLQRSLESILRRIALEKVSGAPVPRELTPSKLQDWFPEFTGNLSQTQVPREAAEVGVSYALVVSELGGDYLRVEVSLIPRKLRTESDGHSRLVTTGLAGQAMSESHETALTCVRSFLNKQSAQIETSADVHIHMTRAGVKKDGPSGGLPVAVALISAFTNKPVQMDIALTGELTLRGRIEPVGGLREKILAAERGGFTRVLIPAIQFEEAKRAIADDHLMIEIVPVQNLSEALDICLL